MLILKDDACGSLKMVLCVQKSHISRTVGIKIRFRWADHKWSGETHCHLHLVVTCFKCISCHHLGVDFVTKHITYYVTMLIKVKKINEWVLIYNKNVLNWPKLTVILVKNLLFNKDSWKNKRLHQFPQKMLISTAVVNTDIDMFWRIIWRIMRTNTKPFLRYFMFLLDF